jgi:dTDP-4-dehydrorhamnose reductase
MIKILIYGGNGWIGGMMCKLLSKNNINYIKSSVRADNKSAVAEELDRENPTHVMSFIGRTHGTHNGNTYTTIDYLEQKGKIRDNVRDNLFSPIVLAILCSPRNIHFTYIGTGCIFNYDENHSLSPNGAGWREEDNPNFFGSSYSIVKGYTDELMHLFNTSVLNLRIRMPIVSHNSPRNFINKIIRYKKICSIPNSMSVLDELLPLALDMALKREIGTVNLVNPGVISHNQILQMYKDNVNPYFKWENFNLEEQSRVLDADRSNNRLDTTKLEQMFPDVLPIQAAVLKCIKKMA